MSSFNRDKSPWPFKKIGEYLIVVFFSDNRFEIDKSSKIAWLLPMNNKGERSIFSDMEFTVLQHVPESSQMHGPMLNMARQLTHLFPKNSRSKVCDLAQQLEIINTPCFFLMFRYESVTDIIVPLRWISLLPPNGHIYKYK